MIHSTAIISKKLKYIKTLNIGPFCIIDDNVEIQEGTELISNVHIGGNTSIGLK